MYEEFFGHFGLQRNPFHVSPDPKRFFSTVAHDEALLQLVFGIESRKGLMVLTGEPGTGKTTILQYLLDWLGQYKYSTAYVFHPLLPSMDLLQLILGDFGVPCESRNKADIFQALKDWLTRRHAEGDRPVIIVDEAQVLRSRSLDELNLLLDLEEKGAPLVQVLLAGQPELEEKLRERKLSQLRRRIATQCKLRPLTLQETSGYIASRLQGVKEKTATDTSDTQTFSPEIVAEIYRYTKGIPRVVNLVCEHSLLAAYADRRNAISRSDVLRVAHQFDLGGANGAGGESYSNDTFTRLIPFPQPGAAEINPQAREMAEESSGSVALASPAPEDAALMEHAVDTEPALAFSSESAETGSLEAGATPMTAEAEDMYAAALRGLKELLVYFAGAARSFAKSSAGFAGRVMAWMRKPLRVAPRMQASLKARARALHARLRMPIGAAPLSGDGSQVQSAAQKHF